jgi:hypothetical protein
MARMEKEGRRVPEECGRQTGKGQTGNEGRKAVRMSEHV